MTKHEQMLLRERFADGTDCDTPEYTGAVRRLENGEPLAYILGKWWFMRETYRVTPDVLIPQPDTEILVGELIKRLAHGGCFADLGCGSGCVGISALAARPDATATAVDISPAAVKIAIENAAANGVRERYHASIGDIFNGDAGGEGMFDAIVSNPPYIRSEVIPTLSAQVLAEPHAALDGGEDGLGFYRAILNNYPSRIKQGGVMLLEIGFDQAAALRDMCHRYGYCCEILRDYGGNDRVVIINL